MASAIGEGSSMSQSISAAEKPVIVRVKRKPCQPPLDGFWLEINERPLKRPLLDFEKLSLSESSKSEELKFKKVFVQHVETVTKSEATIDIVQSFLSNSTDVLEHKTKHEERRHSLKKDNRQVKQVQLLSKARQNQETSAKSARFEQIWRSRKGAKEGTHDIALHEMYHFYDVVRVDVVERSTAVHAEELSLEDQRMLSSYLPLLQEFIPSAAAELESDIRSYMAERDEYVYDYYTVNDDMKVDNEDASNPFPLVQVEDDDFYDVPYESEYDSEDSNAEDNPQNDYPDEISEDNEEDESQTSKESEEDEHESGSESSSELDLPEADHLLCDDDDDDDVYDDELYFGNDDDDDHSDYNDSDHEDWR